MSIELEEKSFRIIHVITGLDTGGAETMLFKLLSEMDNKKFSQSVISLLEGGSLRPKIEKLGVPVYSLGMKHGIPSLRALWRLKNLITRLQPDLIQGWMYHGNFAASLAGFLFRSGDCKVLWNIRASLNKFSNEKLLTEIIIRIEAKLSRHVEKVIYNSLGSKKDHLSLGYCHKNSIMIPNGFDMEIFKPDELARRAIRCELGLLDDAFLIGRIGRYHQMKDYSNFLKAAGILLQKKPETHFLLAGREVDSRNQELMNGIRANGLTGHIFLLGERSDIPKVTAALDLSVSSSRRSESFPNVIGEAMCCAVPCVVTDIGDSSLIVGEFGKVVPHQNSKLLADVIESLMNEGSAKIRSRGKASRERMSKNYSINKIVDKYQTLYCDALKKPSEESCIRIVHVITGLSIGGAEMMLLKLLSAMDKDRFSQHVISLVGQGDLCSRFKEIGVPVYSLGMKSGVPSLLALFKLRSILNQLKPDLVHGWMYHGNIAVLVARFLCGRNKHKILWNMRASASIFLPEKKLTRFIIRYGSIVSKNIDKIVYNSFASRRDHRLMGYDRENGTVIPNGFDTEIFKPDICAKKSVRLELALPEDAILIGIVARYHPMKDHENFLNAANIISKKNSRVHFLMVGKNINYENEELMELVRVNSLVGRVSLVDERNDINKLTAAMDIAVLSSETESFPNVVGEAMSCSVPCVVTDVGDAAAIVGDAGLVVPSQNSELLADAIESLINEGSAKIHSRGKASRERVIKNYSLKRVVNLYQQLYREMLP
jgi:glycosyltransferase involved in cell wall biosynthesis